MRGIYALIAATVSLLPSVSATVPWAGGKCAGAVEHEWLDIIFVVDSSNSMTSDGLENVRGFIQSVLYNLRLGSGDFETRAGIVAYADLSVTQYALNIQGTDVPNLEIPFLGVDGTNLQQAITDAITVFEEDRGARQAPRVMVIIASIYNSVGSQNPNQVAAEFRESGGTIITINFEQNTAVSAPKLDELASPGYAFSNHETSFTPGDLLNAMTFANCFCPQVFQPISANKFDSPEYGCINQVTLPAMFVAAQRSCHDQNAYLIKIDSDYTQNAATKLFTENQKIWIGLQYDRTRNKYLWEDGTEALISKWPPHQPDTAVGDCVYSQNGFWYTANCNDNYDYVCETRPCSTEYNCYDAADTPPTYTTNSGEHTTRALVSANTRAPPPGQTTSTTTIDPNHTPPTGSTSTTTTGGGGNDPSGTGSTQSTSTASSTSTRTTRHTSSSSSTTSDPSIGRTTTSDPGAGHTLSLAIPHVLLFLVIRHIIG